MYLDTNSLNEKAFWQVITAYKGDQAFVNKIKWLLGGNEVWIGARECVLWDNRAGFESCFSPILVR